MGQSTDGALKVRAARAGYADVSEFRKRELGGEKWCYKCKTWHPRSAFHSDRSRYDGLDPVCRDSRRTGHPRGWHERPAVNPVTGRSGPAPMAPRSGDKIQARQRVNVEVRCGRRPHPNSIPCTDCGHEWKRGDRRHEYDHHLGYAAEHHLDVQSVCTTCHHKREASRG